MAYCGHCRRYVLNGFGLFTEGYTLFSIGNLTPLFQAVWPQCFKNHTVCSKNLLASVRLPAQRIIPISSLSNVTANLLANHRHHGGASGGWVRRRLDRAEVSGSWKRTATESVADSCQLKGWASTRCPCHVSSVWFMLPGFPTKETDRTVSAVGLVMLTAYVVA